MNILLLLLLYSLLLLLYSLYQLIRNNKIYNIRKSWIIKNDPRLTKYTYDYMIMPSRINYYGIKYPQDKDFI